MSVSQENNKSHFLDKVAFIKHLSKIKNESVRNYFIKFFSVRNLLFKLLLFIVIGAIVMGSGFGIEMWFIKNKPNEIVLNPGVGFSFGENFSPSVVYFIQSIPIVIALIAFIFIPQWWIAPGFLMMMFGGLSNIIDRGLDFDIKGIGSSLDAVVDYWPFVKTTINMNDVWICIGVGFIVLSLIVWLVLTIKNSKNDEIKKENELINDNIVLNQDPNSNVELTIDFNNLNNDEIIEEDIIVENDSNLNINKLNKTNSIQNNKVTPKFETKPKIVNNSEDNIEVSFEF